MEVWLRTNTRAIWFGTALPVTIALVGVLLMVGWPGFAPPTWLRGVGGAALFFSLVTTAALLWQLRQPRLAYQAGHLLIWLRSGRPFAVPIDAVECFWLGQAPTMLPGKQNERAETAAIVIRIADAAQEWRHQDVKPQLGKWCEGYVTIRGTWCEPLSIDLTNRLNHRLAEVTRQTTGKASS